MIKRLGDDILKLNEALSIARRNREDNHNKIIRHLDEIQNKLYRDLAVRYFFSDKNRMKRVIGNVMSRR